MCENLSQSTYPVWRVQNINVYYGVVEGIISCGGGTWPISGFSYDSRTFAENGWAETR